MISARFGIFMERSDIKGAQGISGSEQGAAAHLGCSNSESLSVDLGLFVLGFGGMEDAGGGKGHRGGGVSVLVLPECCSVIRCLLHAEPELYGMRPERQPQHGGRFLEKRELGVHPIPSYSLQLCWAGGAPGCQGMWKDGLEQ